MPETRVASKNATSNTANKVPKRKSDQTAKLEDQKKSISSLLIIKKSLRLLANSWKFFSIIFIIYLAFNVIFIRGIGSDTSFLAIKDSFNGGFDRSLFFSNLFSSSASNDTASSIQPFLLVIFSIIIIWSIRETINKHLISVRDALYKSLYSLISFSLVSILIGIEFIPFVIGAYIFSVVFGNNIANNLAERLIFGVISLGLVYVSLFLVISTILSVYIVTLPNIRPMQAIRSSWKLSKLRRMDIFWKLLLIALIIIILNVIIMIPFIILATAIAGWALFVLSIISVIIFHTFMYNFYREML